MRLTQWLRLGLAFAAVALVYLYRLDRPLLWGDEGHTAALAHGILRTGLPTAFDGRNLVLFDIRAGLNRHLISKEVPWVQWYVGAASIELFGDNTAGVRALYAMIGVLAFFPLWGALRGRVKLPDLVAALALIAPQAALFDRNARYYSILVFLGAALVWHLTASFQTARVRHGLSVLIFLLFFHTHILVAVGMSAALGIYCLLWRRADLRGYMAAAGFSFLTWFIWYQALGPALTDSPVFQSWSPVRNFGDWCVVFARSVLAMVVDMDVVGALPLLLLAGAAGILFFRRRQRLLELCRDPVFGFVLIAIAVQTVGTAALSSTETEAKLALLRYMPHLVVLGLAACLVALDAVMAAPLAFAAVCAAAVACNAGCLSWWVQPFGRRVPASWAGPVYSEIFHPRPDAWEGAIAFLRQRAPAASEGDRSILTVPPWIQPNLIFYLGDKYIIPPDYVHQQPPQPDHGEAFIQQTIGREAYGRLYADPQWLFDSLNVFKEPPAGWVEAAIFPSHRTNAADGTRPELTRHAFWQDKPPGVIAVYERAGE